MSDFGFFEVLASSPDEEQLARNRATDKLAEAIYDVREAHGDFLFLANDIEGFRDRVALVKDDALKIINRHLMPVTGVVRRIMGKNGALEKEFRSRLAAEYKHHSPTNIQVNSTDPEGHRWEGYFGTPERAEEWGKSRDVGDPYNPIPENGHAAQREGFRKGAPSSGNEDDGRLHGPFAGYDDWEDCTSQNSDKGDADAYCGEIYHNVEDGRKRKGEPLTNFQDKESSRAAGRHQDPWNELGPSLNEGTVVADPPELEDAGSPPPYDRKIVKRVPGTPGDSEPRHQARRRRADATGPDMNIKDTFEDHQGEELDPEGNFHGYLDSVDQGAPSKVDSDFVDRGDTTRHDGDPSNSDFVEARRRRADAMGVGAPEKLLTTDDIQDMGQTNPAWSGPQTPGSPGSVPTINPGEPPKVGKVVRQYARFCQANKIPFTLQALERHGSRLTPKQYLEIAAAIQRRADAASSAAPGMDLAKPDAVGGVGGVDPFSNNELGTDGQSGGATNGNFGAQSTGPDMSAGPGGDPSTYAGGYPNIARRRQAKSWTQNPDHPDWIGHHSEEDLADNEAYWNGPGVHETSPDQAAAMQRQLADERRRRQSRRRQAAPDHLQKAMEALTNLLNDKAQQFQEGIAPLQQALQVVQQAKAVEQTMNPMQVQPPAGTVNVLPQPPQVPGAPGGDPMGAPGADPSGGAGLDQNAPPPAAGDPSQQIAAGQKRGGAHPKGRTPARPGV